MAKRQICFNLRIIITLIILPYLLEVSFLLTSFLENEPIINIGWSYSVIIIGLNFWFKIITTSNLTKALAIKAYVSLSLALSGVYYLIAESHQNCFLLQGTFFQTPTLLDFIYFSFTTVTTLGYGDITPNHLLVRMIVLFQILGGVYLIYIVNTEKALTGQPK